MATKLIQLSLPESLVTRLDAAAHEEFASRSEYIRAAIIKQLQSAEERRAQLLAIATNTDIPTEERLFELLRLKHLQRSAREYFRERRRN